jgi:hypothetical protein
MAKRERKFRLHIYFFIFYFGLIKKIFSDQKQLSQYIDFLDGLDLEDESMSIDDIKYLLVPLFLLYTIVAPLIPQKTRLYRAILYNEKPLEFNNLCYPPAESTRINRGNRAKEPLFYCSLSKGTPFYECKLKKGDTFALATWITKKEMTLNHVGFTKENFFQLDSSRNFNPIVESNNVENKALNEIIETFLSRKFSENILTKVEYKYKLTAAITERLIFFKELDGLMYPSIARKANSDNIALKTNFFDNGGLELIEVEWIKIRHVNGTDYKFDILNYAKRIGVKGNILWTNKPNDFNITVLGNFKETYEDGFTVYRDDLGNIINRNDEFSIKV